MSPNMERPLNGFLLDCRGIRLDHRGNRGDGIGRTIMTTLYEIAAFIGAACLDGRSNHGAWGNESQFHATSESAEGAVARLSDGGHWGCSQSPTYAIVERTRADFSDDAIGEQEWRRACRQAGISPAEVVA